MERLAVLTAAVCVLVSRATNVNFEPGPGLKRNADGSYSRVVDKEYLESVGAGSAAETEAPSSSLANLGKSLLIMAAVALWMNRDAIVQAARSGAPAQLPKRQAKPMTERELAEARAARLARFTGDGPKKAEAAFAEALENNDFSAKRSAAAPKPAAATRPAVATLGSLSAKHGDDQEPDEFFGGDSTNTHY